MEQPHLVSTQTTRCLWVCVHGGWGRDLGLASQCSICSRLSGRGLKIWCLSDRSLLPPPLVSSQPHTRSQFVSRRLEPIYDLPDSLVRIRRNEMPASIGKGRGNSLPASSPHLGFRFAPMTHLFGSQFIPRQW